MTDINNLRERVEAAEQRFGLMDEQQRHYSERVIGLIETIEAQLAAARGEIEKQIDENRQLGQDLAAARSEIEQQVDANLRLSQENEELRAMLHSVLRSIEQKTHMKTLQDLEARVSALVAGAGAPAPQGGVPASDAPEACEAEAAGEIPSEPEIVVEAADFAAEADGPTLVVEAAEETAADTEPMLEMSQPDDAAEDAVAENDPETPTGEQPELLETGELPIEEAVELPETMVADIAAETPDTEAVEGKDEDEDLFAAMAALNAGDETFAEAIAEGTPAGEAEAETAAAEAAEIETADAEAAEIETAEAEAGDIEAGATDSEAIDEAPEDMPGATTEEPADDADDGSAPTVKEIIRRVGDLARELERAEAARRASRAAGEEQGDPAHPPFERAVNG